jgi:hypothetical protein
MKTPPTNSSSVLHEVDQTSWHAWRGVKDWRNDSIHKQGQSNKAMRSLAVLISWEIWKERNARFFFWNNASTLTVIITKIKEEVKFWSLPGAKALSNVMLQV